MNQELFLIHKRIRDLKTTANALGESARRLEHQFNNLIYDFRDFELKLMTQELEKMQLEKKSDVVPVSKPAPVKKPIKTSEEKRGESKKPGSIKRPGSIESARKNLRYLVSIGMSQSQIAKGVGVAQSTISELKKYGASMTTIKALLMYTRTVRAERRAEFEQKKQAVLNLDAAP